MTLKTQPLQDRLKDPERMYRYLALGMTLVSGADLKWMGRQMRVVESKLSKKDKLLLRANWKRVRARLKSEGYV